jgi:hypothetical protein
MRNDYGAVRSIPCFIGDVLVRRHDGTYEAFDDEDALSEEYEERKKEVPLGSTPLDGFEGYYAVRAPAPVESLGVCSRCGAVVYAEKDHDRFHSGIVQR